MMTFLIGWADFLASLFLYDINGKWDSECVTKSTLHPHVFVNVNDHVLKGKWERKNMRDICVINCCVFWLDVVCTTYD